MKWWLQVLDESVATPSDNGGVSEAFRASVAAKQPKAARQVAGYRQNAQKPVYDPERAARYYTAKTDAEKAWEASWDDVSPSTVAAFPGAVLLEDEPVDVDVLADKVRAERAARSEAQAARSLSLSQKEQCTQRDAADIGWSMRSQPCPLEGFEAVDKTTGQVAWEATCKSARCPRCSRRVSTQTFALARRAMAEQDRGRFITLTRAPEGWQETRKAMQDLAQAIRRDLGRKTEWLWVVERGEDTGMKHVHAIQHGDFIPGEWLYSQWGSRVEIKAARSDVDGYLAKNVIRYLGKGLDSERLEVEAHMNLNGGRAAHWSRGFFNGMSRTAFKQAHPLPGIYFLEAMPTGL